MLIREYTENDLDALRAIHPAQGFDYALPDLRNPLFVTKLVLSGDDSAGGGSPSFVGAQHAAPLLGYKFQLAEERVPAPSFRGPVLLQG